MLGSSGSRNLSFVIRPRSMRLVLRVVRYCAPDHSDYDPNARSLECERLDAPDHRDHVICRSSFDPDKWDRCSMSFVIALRIILIMIQTLALETASVWSRTHWFKMATSAIFVFNVKWTLFNCFFKIYIHSMLQNKCIGTADDHVCYNLSVVCISVHTCRINAQEATPTYPLSLCGVYGLQCRTGP